MPFRKHVFSEGDEIRGEWTGRTVGKQCKIFKQSASSVQLLLAHGYQAYKIHE